MGEYIPFLVALLAAGAFAGLIAGLFGVGGGTVIVPVLHYLFLEMGVDEGVSMHAAIGTSLATIIVTSARSVHAHAKRGVVDFKLLKAWGPQIAFGAVVGAGLARFLTAEALMVVFGVGAAVVSIRTALKTRPEHPAPIETPHKVFDPHGPLKFTLASGTGVVSSLMGIGGGVLGVSILTSMGRPIHQAVATAAGLGIAIAAPGALGFMAAGMGESGLPAGSIGYVNLFGFTVISAMTAVTAPWGAHLAHAASKTLLARVFSIYLGFVSFKMLWDAFAG